MTRWLGWLVVGASVLELVGVLLPWTRATVDLRPDILPVGLVRTATGNGLGSGDAPWGLLTLLGAFVAGGLGAMGGVRRTGRLAGAAIIPALVALAALVIAASHLGERKDLLGQELYPLTGNIVGLTPEARAAINSYLNNHIKTSLQYGWYLALVMTLLIIVVGIAALITGARR